MEISRHVKDNESYLLLLAPLAGLALVVTFQMGRYGFYGAPLRLVQLDTAKVVLSALPLTIFALASLSAIGNVLTEATSKGKWLFLQCLAFSAFLSSPFWLGRTALDWSWILLLAIYLLFAASVIYAATRFVVDLNTSTFQGKDPAGKIASVSTVLFFVVLLVLTSTYAYGYFQEADARSRLYVAGTQDAVVDQVGDMFILATIDPKTKKPLRKGIRLVKIPDAGIEIEERLD